MEKKIMENGSDKIFDTANELEVELQSKGFNCTDALAAATLFVIFVCRDAALSVNLPFADMINKVIQGLATICELEEGEDNKE